MPFGQFGVWGDYYDPETDFWYFRSGICEPDCGKWSSTDPFDGFEHLVYYLYSDNSTRREKRSFRADFRCCCDVGAKDVGAKDVGATSGRRCRWKFTD